MIWLWIVLAVLVLLVGVATAIGAALPRDHRGVVERVHEAPLSEVWRLLTDVPGYPRWRSDLKKVEIREQEPAGRVVAWTEVGKAGRMPLRIVEERPETRLVGRVDADDLPFGGTWTYELEETAPGSTRLRITEDGVVKNPLFRFIARYCMGYETTLRAYQEMLARELARTT